MKGIFFVATTLAAATAYAEPAQVDVHVDVEIHAAEEAAPAPLPRRFLSLSRVWTARDGEGYRLDLELAHGSGRHWQSAAATWTAGIAASRIGEQAIYYGHDDEISARDTAVSGFVASALRLGRLETRVGFGAGFETTSGIQTAYGETPRILSRTTPVADVFADFSISFGSFAAVLGWRIIGHAQRYDTLDEMDTFTREPTVLAFVGVSAALD